MVQSGILYIIQIIHNNVLLSPRKMRVELLLKLGVSQSSECSSMFKKITSTTLDYNNNDDNNINSNTNNVAIMINNNNNSKNKNKVNTE